MKYVFKIAVILAMISIAGVSLAAPKKGGAKAAPKAAKAPKAKPELKDVTVTGTISKTEVKGKESYVLTDGSGQKITLPKPKGEINLADFDGKQVTVVGKGSETKRGEKTSVKFSTIDSITPADGGGVDADAPPGADDGDF